MRARRARPPTLGATARDPSPRLDIVKIAVVGIGYVGLSNAVILAQHHEVCAVDLDAARVERWSTGASRPIEDPELEDYLADRDAATSPRPSTRQAAYAGADFVVIATPTDYDPDDQLLRHRRRSRRSSPTCCAIAPDATMVVKSTVPVGFTARMREEHPDAADHLHPGVPPRGPGALRQPAPVADRRRRPRASAGKVLRRAARRGRAATTDVPVLLTDSTEAEAIKLFANTYLALRVAFFNELDTYAAHARPRHRPDHRGRRPRPADRQPLQQPELRLRRLLPAQGHQAAPGELPRRPAEPDQRDRRGQHHAQGLHRRRHPAPRAADRRHLPADHEGRLGQLPDVRRSRA